LIRAATPDDIPRLLEMARAHHAVMTGLPPLDDDSFAATARGAIEGPASVVLISDGGSLCGAIQPFYFNAAESAAIEFWWNATDATGGQLLAGVEAWAQDRGAGWVMMSGDARNRTAALQRVLTRRGYDPINFVMSKELKSW